MRARDAVIPGSAASRHQAGSLLVKIFLRQRSRDLQRARRRLLTGELTRLCLEVNQKAWRPAINPDTLVMQTVGRNSQCGA